MDSKEPPPEFLRGPAYMSQARRRGEQAGHYWWTAGVGVVFGFDGTAGGDPFGAGLGAVVAGRGAAFAAVVPVFAIAAGAAAAGSETTRTLLIVTGVRGTFE